MARLSDGILRQWIDVDCPGCDFGFEVQLLDVRVQAYTRCPCCRQRIRLIDGGGSTFGALEDIDQAMRSLEQTLRKF